MMVHQAYRFALEPTPSQERMLRSHAGAARFAWNWGLAQCKERYEAEGKWYSGVDLHKLWNEAKKADPALAWWGENSKCAYQEAFRNLDRALGDFIKSRRGERKGRKPGFPRFKKRGKCRDSFRFTTGAMRCTGTTVTLPRLGTVRTHEPTRKLARRRRTRKQTRTGRPFTRTARSRRRGAAAGVLPRRHPGRWPAPPGGMTYVGQPVTGPPQPASYPGAWVVGLGGLNHCADPGLWA